TRFSRDWTSDVCSSDLLVTIRIDAVRTDIEAERRTGAFPPGTAESFDEIRPGADALDGRELRPQRLDAERVQPLHVHVARVVVGDLLLERARSGLRRHELVDDLPYALVGFVAQPVEDAVAALVRRNLEARKPGAVRIAEEVV